MKNCLCCHVPVSARAYDVTQTGNGKPTDKPREYLCESCYEKIKRANP